MGAFAALGALFGVAVTLESGAAESFGLDEDADALVAAVATVVSEHERPPPVRVTPRASRERNVTGRNEDEMRETRAP